MMKKLSAEVLGTFWLVFGGCGSAVLAASFPNGDPALGNIGIGFVGVALAFGLTVLTMAYAVGHISGAHFNPAVTLGLAVGGRIPWSDVIPYWIAQVVGGIVAAVILYLIASGKAGWVPGGFASNGYGANSPGGYALFSCLLIEIVLTAGFVMVILGTTHKNAPSGFAPLAIGLALTQIHQVSIPVTNTSVNPARSTAVAFFAQNGALGQLWLFWVAPLIGGALGAVIWTGLLARDE
jgi:aquaporin Z